MRKKEITSILKQVKDLVKDGIDIKSGKWNSDRKTFETRTTNDLIFIKKKLEESRI